MKMYSKGEGGGEVGRQTIHRVAFHPLRVLLSGGMFSFLSFFFSRESCVLSQD